MRLGVSEVGVTELMGVTEHARATATAAGALGLDSPGEGTPLVAPLEPAEADLPVRELLEEIGRWWTAATGRTDIPVLWRILARNSHYLESTWQKEQAAMQAGALGAHDKRRTALAVAMAVRGRHMIESHAAILRHAGDTDRDILEVLGVVDHYTTLNTLSESMQIASDIRPPA